MRVIVAGSRGIIDKSVVFDILDSSRFEITSVVCGMAPGVDLLGREWARSKGIDVIEFPADWEREGTLTAGSLRNQRMAENADALILIWDGTSSGSRDMLSRARKHKLALDICDVSVPRLI